VSTRFAWASALLRDQRPLQVVLVVLALVTGMVDSVTYLDFGHVFAANMTGNVIVLGFALVGAGEISATASVVSLALFIAGAGVSARLADALHPTRHRWLLTMLGIETGLLTVAALLSLKERAGSSDLVIVGLLALGMGMRTATVRRLGIADVSTTVLTSTLAGLAADTLMLGVTYRALGVRLVIVVAMLVGAASGALLLAGGVAQVLGLSASLVLVLTMGYIATLR
jgi:uncharacterized membrane protein YoaK (UPF0700 family)